jgi:5-amino-6-(5-phosphoribosylamino)uracil reductase/diaminohydroxyphosphoribosylaminopyrimidine deaminase/5-amino-6-(5-phosphoribosylamino)uracil reductase
MGRIPRVTLSYAQSLDGRIATATGDSRWISGPDSLRLAHRLRRDHEALLVGIGTVLRDDPQLTCRLPGRHARNPARVVLDSSLRLPPDSRLARGAGELPTLVFTSAAPSAGSSRGGVERRSALEALGVRIVESPPDPEGRVPLRWALERLADLGYASLFVEGGAQVITSFLRQGLVHRLLVVVTPLLIGEGVQAVGDLGVRSLSEALRPRRSRVLRCGAERVWELEFDGA